MKPIGSGGGAQGILEQKTRGLRGGKTTLTGPVMIIVGFRQCPEFRV